MADEFGQLSSKFLEEFKSQAGGTFHQDLEIVDLRRQGRGRGIIATADIPTDTELFKIPRDYVISVEKSRLSEKLPHLFGGVADNNGQLEDDEPSGDEDDSEDNYLLPKPWLDLILVLLYDYLNHDTSKWKAYWDILPTSFDTLMFWSESELGELQASAIRGRIGKQSADSMFKARIIPVLKKHESVFYSDNQLDRFDDGQLLSLCHRMGSLIMAYAFDLQTSNDDDDEDQQEAEDGWTEDKETQTAMGMVPMADMLNADAEFNAHLEHGEHELTMRSLREIKKGEEVLNYYGPLGNGDLARRYGYTSNLHARYDVVEIAWEAVVKKLKEIFDEQALDMTKLGINEDDMEESFILERETGDPDETGRFTSQARFTTFPEELVDQITALTSAAISNKHNGKPVENQKKKLKQIFLRTMSRVIEAKTAEYPTTIAQDEDLVGKGTLTTRGKMAVDVRLGEKRLLREIQTLVEELMRKYEDGAQQPPQKKQKLGT